MSTGTGVLDEIRLTVSCEFLKHLQLGQVDVRIVNDEWPVKYLLVEFTKKMQRFGVSRAGSSCTHSLTRYREVQADHPVLEKPHSGSPNRGSYHRPQRGKQE